MLKNRKNLLIVFSIVGVVLIGIGYYVFFQQKEIPLKEKVKLKPVVINSSFVAKVGDSLLVSDEDKFGYYNLEGKKIVEENYKFNMNDYSLKLDARDNLFVVTEDGDNYGVIDNTSKEIIPKMYKNIRIGSKKCFVVQDSNLLWSVIDSNNTKIFDVSYDSVEFVEGFGFILKKDKYYNFIDLNGKMLSNTNYATYSNYFDSDLDVPVIVGQKDGVLDIFILRSGNIKIIKGATSTVSVNEKYVYYTTDGKSYSSYDIATGKTKKNVKISYAINGMTMTINDKELVGYKSEDGKTVISAKYDFKRANDFTKYGLVVVGINNLFGVIDKESNEILPIKYKDVTIFSEKLFAVHDDSSKSFYLVNDKKEKLFDTVVFKKNIDDLLVVYKDEKCGIINNYGKSLFDTEYSYCEIYNGAAVVADTNNQWQILKVE